MASQHLATNPDQLADELVLTAVRLVRWLKAADPVPQLTGAQASALAVIVHSGGIRPADLARLEEVKRPTMARVITSLVKRGLVIRKAINGDGRGALLVASTAGVALLNEGQARRCQPLSSALAAATPEQREAIGAAVGYLKLIVDNALSSMPLTTNPNQPSAEAKSKEHPTAKRSHLPG